MKEKPISSSVSSICSVIFWHLVLNFSWGWDEIKSKKGVTWFFSELSIWKPFQKNMINFWKWKNTQTPVRLVIAFFKHHQESFTWSTFCHILFHKLVRHLICSICPGCEHSPKPFVNGILWQRQPWGMGRLWHSHRRRDLRQRLDFLLFVAGRWLARWWWWFKRSFHIAILHVPPCLPQVSKRIFRGMMNQIKSLCSIWVLENYTSIR